MKVEKRILHIFIACALAVCLATNILATNIVGLENFNQVRTYDNGTFSDISSSAWYFDNVVSVYEYSLMEGNGTNHFDPLGYVTIAQAVTIASRIHSIYYNGVFPEIYGQNSDTGAWYDIYVSYALEADIIPSSYLNYDALATRAQFAEILSKSIDPLDFEEISWIDDGAIPDIPTNADYADAVYMLYRAGILAGSDSAGNFKPNSTITRAEVAAIITRIVDPNLRQTVELNGSY